ncbi:hypothetical protein GOV08_05510 [Candidatus Woesearchaeota archaeon]|nr:hypothetical protein [Candidatus Woesearchaeota archaeon]
MIDLALILGTSAGILTTSSMIPQVFRIIQRKETKDISLLMFLSLAIGIFIWFVYGIIINQIPIIIFNAISFILASIIIGFKIKYG